MCKIGQQVPDLALKIPTMVIFFGPFLLLSGTFTMFTFFFSIEQESLSESVDSLSYFIFKFVSQGYLIALLYSFYYLIREVVFFEHLLGGIEAENANPAFN